MRDLTKFAFCVVLVIFSNYDATKCECDPKSKPTLSSPSFKRMDDRRRISDDSPSPSDDDKLAKTAPDKKLRALRMPQMDNTLFYIIGAVHSTVQAFLFQLQTLMQFGFLMMAGLGLRSFLNRGANDGVGATNRVLQVDNAIGTVTAPPVNNVPAFRPIDIVSFNRFPNDFTGFVGSNFNPIASSITGLSSAGFADPRFTTFFNTNANNGINRMGTSSSLHHGLGLANFNNQNYG